MTAMPDHMTEIPGMELLRLGGAIFVRAEYTENWAYDSLDGPTTANILRPGANRIILFHVVAAGRCWISTGGEKYWANQGDVIVLPYGDAHSMGGQEPAEPVSISTFMSPPPWDEFPVLRLGQGGSRTDVVCGYLHCDDPLFDPGLRALPPLFVVTPDESAARWVEASVDYALSASSSSTRLPELLLIEVLRLHLATAPDAARGWFAALHDPVLAPALASLHAQPEKKWTVADLAAAAHVSRSLLDSRFRELLGRSPIRYLADWRMHVAADLLASTDLSIFDVARRVGYDSEEAFSRAFKRERGQAPSVWRAGRRAAVHS